MTYAQIPLKRLLSRNDGGVWGEDPDGSNDTIVLRSTEQTADGHWAIEDPAPRKLIPGDATRYQLHAGDLLVTKSSGSSNHIGKTTLVTEDVASLRACYSNFMQRLRLSDSENSRFYWYVLRTRETRNQMSFHSTTSTGLANLNGGILGELLVPAPSRKLQDRIAFFLDRETAQIDDLIGKQERLIELLAEKRQAVITQAVTKGLDPSTPTKPSGMPWIGEIPAHWSVPKLGMHSRLGNGSTPSRENLAYWEDGTIPWLNSSHVNRDEVTDSDQFITNLAAAECHLPKVAAGSLIVGLTGQGRTRGMTSIVRFETTINQHLAYVAATEQHWNSDYLLLFLQAAYDRLRELSDENGSTKGALTCAALKNLPVCLPPLLEQALIAATVKVNVAKIDSIVEASRHAIDLLRERRSALISAAVTGKIDVREGVA